MLSGRPISRPGDDGFGPSGDSSAFKGIVVQIVGAESTFRTGSQIAMSASAPPPSQPFFPTRKSWRDCRGYLRELANAKSAHQQIVRAGFGPHPATPLARLAHEFDALARRYVKQKNRLIGEFRKSDHARHGLCFREAGMSGRMKFRRSIANFQVALSRVSDDRVVLRMDTYQAACLACRRHDLKELRVVETDIIGREYLDGPRCASATISSSSDPQSGSDTMMWKA